MEERSLQQASFGGKGDLCYLERLIGFLLYYTARHVLAATP